MADVDAAVVVVRAVRQPSPRLCARPSPRTGMSEGAEAKAGRGGRVVGAENRGRSDLGPGEAAVAEPASGPPRFLNRSISGSHRTRTA